ncbi:putative Protein SAND [Nannochloris sp. 'desiccata']|nr:hypothetical protein KSW81_003362 [Chlorella desiccata (nom. nud.)]KAH7623010.1 putative Protein SAND [Chlorella desiccata (nom. nud.)]
MTEPPKINFPLTQLNTESLEDVLEQHDKQFLVFSSAGKPIYAYHGNEEKLSSFMATAEALMSVATASRSESLRYIRQARGYLSFHQSGRNVVAFLDRSPICLVAISTLAEPPAVLRMQLALIHGQLTSLLTASAVNSIFTKNPGYDARRLLAGSDIMLGSLIKSFTSTPNALLGAFPSFPLLPTLRTTIIENLKMAVAASNSLFGLIISGGSVVALASSNAKLRMQQWDILLLLNFLKSNLSLRQAGTVFAPLCLPTYNPHGHLHAYIQFLDTQTDIAVVLLAGGANPDFEQLSAAQEQLRTTLVEGGDSSGGILGALRTASQELTCSQCRYTSLETLKEALTRAGIGLGCLLHCVYKRSAAQQFVATPWATVVEEDDAMKRGPLQTLRYEARKKFSLLALSGTGSELYLVLDCFVEKAEAVKAASEVLRSLVNRHDALFF